MFYEIFRSLTSTIGAGGLFDFGLTLPLLSIQFLVLVFVLSNILYNPLLSAISERHTYIQHNLLKAHKLLQETNQIKKSCEDKILRARKNTVVEITKCQKIFKTSSDIEINDSQNYFDTVTLTATSKFARQKKQVLADLEVEVESISKQIFEKILV
jgi:F-type H+-transporting ATPase subunit b